MNETEFNLLDEPWIRVLDMQNSIQEVSLKELLLHSHTFRAFSGELATQDAAIMRVALALLHAVFSRTDETGTGDPPEDETDAMQFWKRIWDAGKLPAQPLNDYFDKWHERFWLFHPERPFYQVAGLSCGTLYSAAKLNGTILESGNKANPRLFLSSSGDYKDKLKYSEAARWLIHLQSFDDSGGKPSNEGKAARGKLPSTGVGWLGQIGLIWIKGKTVFETLMRNWVLVNQGAIPEYELPIWERREVPDGERINIPLPNNLSELYTIQSRRVLLFREDAHVTGYRLLGGDFFDNEKIAFFEPMTIWKGIKNKTQIINVPQTHQAAVQLWREFPSCFNTVCQNNSIPGVILWNQNLIMYGCLPRNALLNLQIAAVEYVEKKSSIQNLFSDELNLHLSLLSDVGAAWRQYIQDEIELCGDAAKLLSLLARDLYLASGGDTEKTADSINAAKEQLYFAFDIPFRRWLSSIEAESDHIALQKAWRKEAKQITEHIGREMIRQAGEPALVGRTVTEKEKKHHYSAPKAWGIFLASLRKLYQTGGEQAS